VVERRYGALRVLRVAVALLFFVALLLAARPAGAETLQAPVGGKAISLGDRVACGTAPGWTLAPDGRSIRPPATDDAIGRAVELRVAPVAVGCAGPPATVSLVTTGRWPAIDAATLVVHVDDGRAELRGKKLKGVRLVTEGAGVRSDDICIEPRVDVGGVEVCTFSVSRKLPASPNALSATWYPPGASGEEASVTFDAEGRRALPSELALKPAKITIATLASPRASIDVSSGTARFPLVHADAVTSVDCAPAFCDVQDGALIVRGVTQTAATLRVRARLLTRVVLAKGDIADNNPLFEVPILRCPMTLVSGPPFADVDEARAVVKLEGRCAEDVRSLRFFAGNGAAEVLRIDADKAAAHVLLKLGRVEDEVVLRAVRGDAEGTLVGVLRTRARHLPATVATLELESGVPIDFIPTNRPAIVRIPPPSDGARIVVLPVPGVYTVSEEDGVQRVRGIGPGGGFVSLRYAIRGGSLPPELADANLGIVRDDVQRPMRSGNVPASLAGVIELRCVDVRGRTRTLMPGRIAHIPFEERDGCYVAMHRERLRQEEGVQKLTLDISITRPDGASRPEAHVAEPTVLRPTSGSRVAWIQNVSAPFERVTVRVSHAQDEQHYATRTEQPLTPPAQQWSMIMGTAIARMYLTAAIPTVLYRVSEKATSGILSLNFGVLGRLTWVDSEGRDGILALEAGVTGVGLAPVDASPSGQSLRQVATVAGLGLGVPIVNRATITQTSINLHAWFEYEISRAIGGDGSPFGFIFGPSITFGNVGTYL
jgi:hypothetical protein